MSKIINLKYMVNEVQENSILYCHSAGKRPGPNPPFPQHHSPKKNFPLTSIIPSINWKIEIAKKNFEKF